MERSKKISEWYSALTLESLEDIEVYYDSNCFFKDPFNEIHGVNKVKNIFIHMFSELESPCFKFIDIIEHADQSFLTWDFVFFIRGKEYKIHGSTHLKWDSNYVVYHRDYWDVGEELLTKIPLINKLYSLLVNKLSI